jgi:hypothetical protein
MMTHDSTGISIGDYLIRRLQDQGIANVFGIAAKRFTGGQDWFSVFRSSLYLISSIA